MKRQIQVYGDLPLPLLLTLVAPLAAVAAARSVHTLNVSCPLNIRMHSMKHDCLHFTTEHMAETSVM